MMDTFAKGKRLLSLVLTLSLLLGCVPFGVLASEVPAEVTEVTAETVETWEETEEAPEPTEETLEPAEEPAEEPTEEPTEEPMEPTGEMPELTEEVTEPEIAPVSETEEDALVISVMGDSISTFQGYIPTADGVNLAHATFYPNAAVTAVEQTWWHQVIAALGGRLGINESWSGSRVLNTQDANSGNLGPDAAMASMTRIRNLGSNGTPDIILFFGGTNDIAFGSPPGSFVPGETDLTATKWETYAQSYAAAIGRMQHLYPNAKIVAIQPGPNKSYYTDETLKSYMAVTRAICDHYNVIFCDLLGSGFTTALLADVTHPSAAGMTKIAEIVLDHLEEKPEPEVPEAPQSLAGKTLSILGASMSTFAGTSNGAAADTTNSTIRNNVKYYPNTTIPEVTLTDTWWMQAASDLGLRLLVNNSWSGSSLLHERNGTVGAYVDRCVQLHDDTGDNAGEMPDIIAIQMGTNDFQYYKDTLGTADIDYAALIKANGDGSYTYAQPTTSLEAAAIVLHKISVRYPEAEVYYLNISQRIDGTDALIRSFNAELKQVVEHFGAYIVDIYGSAITMASFDTYIGDGKVHPNRLGMDAYTEAFKRSVLANTDYQVTTHTAALKLEGVTADYGDDKLLVSGDAFTLNLSASDPMEVTVTMGGQDITASVYEAGKITIPAVTADVVVRAKAVYQPKTYRWEFDGTDLAGSNTLTKESGTTTDGIFSKTSYSLAEDVILRHDQSWIVEWKCSGTFQNTNGSSGARIFTSDIVNANYNARYIFKSNTAGLIAMGEKDTAGSHNYGIALADHGIDWTVEHIYRLENRIADDGSNMVYLQVDGRELGPMVNYHIGTKAQGTTSNWLSGKDFTFPYMGTDTHGFTNCSIAYIAVWEGEHTHEWEAAVTAPTCTSQGFTTYTCQCGHSYVGSYTEAAGHSWSGGSCSVCGATRKPYQRLTYFTVDVQTGDGKSYRDNAVLYLPETYSPDGESVKLVIYCKQGASQITPSSNPIEDVGFYNYLIHLGYAVLGVDGVPDGWRDQLGICERAVGNPLAVQGTERAYHYVVDNYNIAADGCFISGYSQGGHYAQNVIDLTDIPILAAAEQSPVCSMRYHQWDLNATVKVGGVSFSQGARLNVARIFGFPAISTNAQLKALSYDASLVADFDPWVRNSENVYQGFVQKSNLWYLPEGTAVEDITMTHRAKCPVKIWCAEDDTAISADVMKVFVKAIQNAGGIAEIDISSTGGHGFFQKQAAVGSFTENGKACNTLPIAADIGRWFARFGGYACRHTYAEGRCTVCGDTGETLELRYDDRYDITGRTVEILDAGSPTSFQVGYGVEENAVADTAVVELRDNCLVATGIGTARVLMDGQLYEITVTAAPINLLLLIGQSNMEGNEGEAKQSISCPDGMVYATYGDRYDMVLENATHYAPSALTGAYRTVNTVGGTDGLSDYPVYMLTYEGDGRKGPDSGFAYEWVQQTGEKVWIVNASHGGTSLNVWQPGTTQYEECQAMFGACAETLRKEIAAGHFTLNHMAYFWCQGCNDYDKTAKWYVENYLSMHESLKQELAFDHDSDETTPDRTFEFGGIIPVRTGHSWRTCYRDGIYSQENPYSHYESYEDLRLSGPRVAQYWMTNNPGLPELWNVCTIGERWVWMPDGTNGVTEYFQDHYPGGTVDYEPQVKQAASWYTPTTPNAVHDSIHYNQIGYNEVGREAVRNALILMGVNPDYEEETTVTLVNWTGFAPAQTVPASTQGRSATLVVPIIQPVTRTKTVQFTLSEGLRWEYYDLLADSVLWEGQLTASTGETVTVVKQAPGEYIADHLRQLPEELCRGVNLWNVLQRDSQYFTANGWGKHSSGKVYSLTIPVKAGDRIFATSFGAAGENGSNANGIRCTFFGEYEVIRTMAPAEVYSEFAANGYLTAPEGTIAVNVPMWTTEDTNEVYLLSLPHEESESICSICGKDSHVHSWSSWETVTLPSQAGPGIESRSCPCGSRESREVNGVWQTLELGKYLVSLPQSYCGGTDLWPLLPHTQTYFHSGTHWDVNTAADVWAVTVPASSGDRIWATSFGSAGENNHTSAGIRVTFFDAYGICKTLTPAETYAEFSANGYLTAPEGTVAVNVPMYGDGGNELYLLSAPHSWAEESGSIRVCSLCGKAEGGHRIDVPSDEVWIDGVKHTAREDKNGKFVLLEGTEARTLVVYSCNDAAASDPHSRYPTGMQVWRLEFENGGYVSTYVPEFENLLQYAGASIRVTGVKGIRMITGIDKALRSKLMDGSLGYRLLEYGTCVAWAEDGVPMLGQGSTMSNYAYKQGVADPIFADTGSVIQYTNVLVGFTDDQLGRDLLMRPYIILEDSSGEQITLYGGCVQRSIGYIAKQNQNTFPEGTKADTYIEDIISKVYG